MESMFNQQAIEDYIAEKVMQRMRAGDLITTCPKLDRARKTDCFKTFI